MWRRNQLRCHIWPKKTGAAIGSARFLYVSLFFGEGDMSANRQCRHSRSFDDDLSRHGTIGIENHGAVTFLADGVICYIADFLDVILDTAHQQFVALLDVFCQFAWRMLDDHIRQIRTDPLVQQNRAAVVFQERLSQITNGGN